MAVSKLNPAASAKTRKMETLTSGSSWTVPAGVTDINVKLFGLVKKVLYIKIKMGLDTAML